MSTFGMHIYKLKHIIGSYIGHPLSVFTCSRHKPTHILVYRAPSVFICSQAHAHTYYCCSETCSQTMHCIPKSDSQFNLLWGGGVDEGHLLWTLLTLSFFCYYYCIILLSYSLRFVSCDQTHAKFC